MTEDQAKGLSRGAKVMIRHGINHKTGEEIWTKGRVLHVRTESLRGVERTTVKVSYEGGGILFRADPKNIELMDG